MPMNFRAAIFDLDGTLLDSMDVWEKIDIKFLQKRGLIPPTGYVKEICARSFEEAAEYTIKLFGLTESIDQIIDEWNNMAISEYATNVRLAPFAEKYIYQLKRMGIKLAIATGLPKELYYPCLANNKIHALFDVICSTDQGTRGKEYPDIFQLAARQLGVETTSCIVFEDVFPAIKSAKQAGMTVFGIYDKYSADDRERIMAIADGYLMNFRDAPLPDKDV